jgi:hypothetical protein
MFKFDTESRSRSRTKIFARSRIKMMRLRNTDILYKLLYDTFSPSPQFARFQEIFDDTGELQDLRGVIKTYQLIPEFFNLVWWGRPLLYKGLVWQALKNRLMLQSQSWRELLHFKMLDITYSKCLKKES